MSLFDFPFFRKSIPSVGNPAFVDDILAANQLTIDGLSALLNLPNPGFAIISGLAYTPGGPGMYGPGVFWLNGFFYFMQTAFQEGLYLSPAPLDVNPKPFSDTNSRNTYTEYYAQATANPVGATPLFVVGGSMAVYRIGLNDLSEQLQEIGSIVSQLGNSAFLNVGTTPGTVAAGNDGRLVGNLAFFDARYAAVAAVIIKNAGTAYVPVAPTDPVNKEYVDNGFINILAKGLAILGNADPIGGSLHTIPLGVTLPDNNYKVNFSIISLSANPASDTYYTPIIRNQTTISFDIYFREASASVQNINLDWYIVPR